MSKKIKKPIPDQSYLHECFAINESYELVWRYRPRSHFADATGYGMWNSRFAGTIAGGPSQGGYLSVKLDNSTYKVHRIIWTMLKGPIPDGIEIDHEDCNRSNNAISNLRDCTFVDNARNRSMGRNNTTGFKGVSQHRQTGKFVATYRKDGRQLYLGLFPTPEEAFEARTAAVKELHGEFYRP